jgi:25S rRNA (uracil2843-N3)-methyltransferase
VAARANHKKRPAPVKHTIPNDNRRQQQQQQLLDVFRHAFSGTLSSPSFTSALQSVKQALYDRNFARAFGDPEHLSVYAARWSPTRALCYASVLEGIQEDLEPLLSTAQGNDGNGTVNDTNTESTSHPQPLQQLKILSIGGGAAELVALGAFLNQHPILNSHPLSGSITLLDSGPWATVITQLTTVLTTPPPLSKYASAAAKLANTALVPAAHITATFHQRDALTLNQTELTALIGNATPLLVTILFTLNELFTASGIGKTTAFLLALTSALPFGSMLLVVDSPGSYSETRIGNGGGGSDKDAKRYPMQWLLDRVLLGTRRDPVAGRRWTKVAADESAWFRLGAGLEYPIPLEDMRYQMHLYRVGDASVEGEDDD